MSVGHRMVHDGDVFFFPVDCDFGVLNLLVFVFLSDLLWLMRMAYHLQVILCGGCSRSRRRKPGDFVCLPKFGWDCTATELKNWLASEMHQDPGEHSFFLHLIHWLNDHEMTLYEEDTCCYIWEYVDQSTFLNAYREGMLFPWSCGERQSFLQADDEEIDRQRNQAWGSPPYLHTS